MRTEPAAAMRSVLSAAKAPETASGTAFPAQGMPDGLTPTYLELGEISGLNLGGGGTLQIDLSSDTFDWACG